MKNQNLRNEINRLQDQAKSSELDMDLFERMICENDRKLAGNKQTISDLEKLVCEKNGKIQQMEAQYQELLDLYINTKVQSFQKKD